MSDLLDAAIAYTARGWPIVPIFGVHNGECECARGRNCPTPGKHPIGAGWQKSAARSEESARAMFERHPSRNLGLLLGEGFVAVDIDPRHGGSIEGWIESYGLPETRIHRTQSGGYHLIYAYSGDDLSPILETDEILGPGCAFKCRPATQIVLPPSRGLEGAYEVVEDREPAPLPDWLAEVSRAGRVVPLRPDRPANGSLDAEGASPYGRAALAGLVREVEEAPRGERNHTLYRAAIRLGQVAATGHVREESGIEALTAAARRSGLVPSEIGATIRSGLKYGHEHPRGARERRRREAPEPTPYVVGLSDLEAFLAARADGSDAPIPSPWEAVNALLPRGGFFAGLHVLIAGTGWGKTQLALELGLAALERDAAIAYVGLELSRPEAQTRMAAIRSGISWSRAWTGAVERHELDALRSEAEALAALDRIYVDFVGGPDWSAGDFFEYCRALRSRHPTGPIVVLFDYLQIIGADLDSPRDDSRARIGKAIYAFRRACVECGITILVISTMSRSNYNFTDFKALGLYVRESGGFGVRAPDVLNSFAKESGEVEAASETVLVLLRHPTVEGRRLVVASKVRAGPVGAAEVLWTGAGFKDAPDWDLGRDSELGQWITETSGPRAPKAPSRAAVADAVSDLIMREVEAGPLEKAEILRRVEEAVGASRSTVQRAIRRLEREGWLSVDHRHVGPVRPSR